MLNVLEIPSSELFALLAAIGFAAGLNLYATVAVLGLLARFGHLPLPPGLLLLWNALHTFVRVPIAGLLAYQATRQLSPEHQLLATLVGGGVALIAHSGKTAARAAVTPSPEPFSNITLSLVEDVLAIGLTWLATRHPYIAGTFATIFVLIILLLARWVIRAMRALFRGAEHEFRPSRT
jgi:hypothetical protein